MPSKKRRLACRQRLGALVRLALAQHQDAESEIGGEPLEQTDFFGGESVALGGVDTERAEYAARFIDERQGDAGAETALKRLVSPRRDARIELVVLDPDDLAEPDRCADRSAPAFDVGPGDPRGVDIAEIVAGARDGTHRPFGVALDVADPGQAIARFLADDAADFGEQVRLVDRPHQRLVAGCEGAQLAIEALDRRLRALASGLLAAEVEHTLAFPSSPMRRVRSAIDAPSARRVLTGGAIPDCNRNERTASCHCAAASAGERLNTSWPNLSGIRKLYLIEQRVGLAIAGGRDAAIKGRQWSISPIRRRFSP